MITLTTELTVNGMSAKDMYRFMLDCGDESYRQWWPGTHLSFHAVKMVPGYVGSVVLMDEYIGLRRLKMHAVVEKADAVREIIWRMKKIIKLPVRLRLIMEDVPKGVRINHTITAGYGGIGQILDPLLRLYFTREFAVAMDEHARVEFPKLKDLLSGGIHG